ncbi:MAG: hypothetical protein IPK15_21650, partial [Verrucomicrobia bacterium]|nr:hypothetical protein [Verrucomicrobiota bacterium]
MSAEEDIYTFTNAPGQRVFFDSFGRNGTIYWQVFDASGKELFNWDFNWGDPGHFTLPVGGTNTVRAFGIGGATGIYGFRVWGVPMAQNYSISIDQTVSDGIPAQGAGRIDAPGAVDFYTFTNAPGQTVFLHSLGRSGVSIYWQLVDATGRELLPANTDIYYDAGRFTLTVAGTNQVRVYTLGESVGTYGFRISTVPSPSEYSIVLDEPVVLDAPEFGAGIIETPGEVDFYTFTNAPGQSVFFDAFERPLGVYWQVTDSQGRELFNSPISGIDPGQFTLPMAGTNRVRVYALDATVATYGFTIWAVPQAQFFTIATDQPVALDVPEAGAGYLETPGAVDLYTFTNASGQVVFFDVLNGPTYIRWQALDAAGREIFDRDFSEGDRGSFTLPIAGTNRVRVYASSGVPDTTGGYSFRVRSVPAPQNFVIAVDQPVRADVPALGAGKIETAGAVDLYSFINAPGQVVYFDVLSGPSYIRWQVLDAAGNELFDRDFSEYDAGVFALPMAGTNRIRAYTRDQTTGTYSFRVRPVPGMQSFTIAIDQAVSADIPFAGTGRIEAPGAVDFYTFTNAPGQTIFFDSFGTTGGVYWQMQDANGRELFNLNFNSGDPGIWHFPQAGTNRIRVYGGGEATGTYGFQLANTAANGAITNLSPRADRFVTSIGATVTNGLPAPGAGNLEAPGAKDIYTFTAIAGTQVYFEDLGASTCCLDWYVYDESGNTVLGDRLDGGDPGRYKLNRSGVYTIVVQPAGAVPEWVGPYSFRLREMPLDQTFSIAIGATVTNGLPAPGAGNLEAPGAKDIYTFTAIAGTQVYFEDLGASTCCL